MLESKCMHLSHHGTITGMLSFMVSRRIKYLVFSTYFVQKVMPYHSNLERTALASCFTENCF